jgi:(1->4)-alpha-D-glucan 1-alpha-D-glucosylmutase
MPTQPAGAQAPQSQFAARIPVSSYRLQFHPGFRFTDAQALVPYFAQLGVTDCYASPFLQARPGSPHGYDICDHSHFNPEVGSEADYAALTAALAAHGMGLIADFVPNHMGVDPAANVWWRDVLENGPCSPFADFFDIDWTPVKDELANKILLPILGDQYGRVLERGELQVAYGRGTFTLHYFDYNLPISPRETTRILEHDVDSLRRDLGESHPQLQEYLSIITELRHLPVYTETEPQPQGERQREAVVARERLQRLTDDSPRIREHVDNAVRKFNGRAGQPQTFDALHDLLEALPYRLSYWRTASHEINYRRFFEINQLAGLRMEEPRVFDATHGLILRLIAAGTVTGLRLDHIDGLFDPAQYLARLQSAIHEQRGDGAGGAGASVAGAPDRFYIVTEKILSSGETLPEQWPVAGTSGYDFLNELNRLFVDRRGQRLLTRIYRRFTHVRSTFAEQAYASKKLIMDTPMASELNVLARALNRLSECDRRTRDFTLNSLRDALQEVVACFPVYRTYVTLAGYTDADREAIDTAIQRARQRNPTMEPSIFDFIRNVMLPDPANVRSPEDLRQRLTFAMKFQQYTGPLQAKGIEDTAFYRYNLLLSLNEVGGDPERFGSTPAEFHAANRRRAERWPMTMLASATHDTKRGEDSRARLNVLSELPDDWGRHLSAWARINAGHRTIVEGKPAPDRNDEYRFYQTLLGTWPPTAGMPRRLPDESLLPRLRTYMLKAVREAKLQTSWITENQAYEAAVVRFVERTLTAPSAARFLASFLPFQQRIAHLGMVNSLSQVVLKVMSPGVPDFYQGSELWDLSLVDPDNRRPVDYAHCQALLAELEPLLAAPEDRVAERTAAVSELLEHWGDGRIKLLLTAAALRLRRRLAALFLTGTYEPLQAQGERAEHVVALARRAEDAIVIAVVPRLVTELTTPAGPLPIGSDSWGGTRLLLPPELCDHAYRNVLTGAEVQPDVVDGQAGCSLATLLDVCPVAILV